MAQRKNKERKQNLLKYKNQSKKMSESKAPEMRPFRQVPNWSSTEKFELNGEEFGVLYNFFNIFAPATAAMQQIFARGYKAGKITVNYEDEQGQPIPDKEIDAYTEQLNAYFREQNEAKGKVVDADAPSEHAKIVSFTGEKIAKEDIVTETI